MALVTAGYGGIGEAVSNGLAAIGAKVAIAGRNYEKAVDCARVVRERGHETYETSSDAASVGETRRMVDEAAGHFGRLDILVSCVALNREEKRRRSPRNNSIMSSTSNSKVRCSRRRPPPAT